MNIELILYGLIALTLGILTRVTESRVSAKEKRERHYGYSEAAYLIGGWALIGYGIIMIFTGVFD